MKERHTPEGWRFGVVNAVIEHVDYLVNKFKLTFVEEQVILSWFQCQLMYNMGKISTADTLDILFPEKEDVTPIKSDIYT